MELVACTRRGLSGADFFTALITLSPSSRNMLTQVLGNAGWAIWLGLGG